MPMGGKPTDGGPGPVVKDGQVLEWSRPASRVRPSCWRCDGTGYIETRKHFPATKYQPEGVVIDSAPCPRCKATRKDVAP
jgi:hypothetical protein